MLEEEGKYQYKSWGGLMISTSTYQTLFETYQDTRFLKKLRTTVCGLSRACFREVYEHINTGNMEIQHDYQSLGATLVNNLAPKLAKLLFPLLNLSSISKLAMLCERHLVSVT